MITNNPFFLKCRETGDTHSWTLQELSLDETVLSRDIHEKTVLSNKN